MKYRDNFPPLINGDFRPVTWDYALNSINGAEEMTNSVTIYVRPNTNYDESGRYDGAFTTVTLLRSELEMMLAALNEDIESTRSACPEDVFV